MTRVLTDGAEMGDTLFFDSVGSASNVTTSPRSGSRCYQIGTTVSTKNVPAVSEGYKRIGIKTNNITGSSNNKYLIWYATGTELGSIRTDTSGHIVVYTGTTTLVATGTQILQINTWYLLEVHIKIADAGGIIDVKIEGIADASFSGDTKPGADTTYNKFGWQAHSGVAIWLDDLAYNDTNGGADNSWCGDGKIVMLGPNGNGASSQLVGSDGNSTDNYLLVDEVPPNSDTDYVESATANDNDLYDLASISLNTGDTILRAFVEARVRETVAGGNSIALGVKSGSTTNWGGNQAVTTSYARYVGTDYTTDPDTAAAWTATGLNALQAGMKVI